jgi:hypothetical protein
MPASMSAFRLSSDAVAGPMVATIFVRPSCAGLDRRIWLSTCSLEGPLVTAM